MDAIEFETKIENGHIEIPDEFKGQLAGNVHVIVWTETPSAQTDFLDYLLANPIKVDQFTPMTREEIYERP